MAERKNNSDSKEEYMVNAPLIRKDLLTKMKLLAAVKKKKLNDLFVEALAEYLEKHKDELRKLSEMLS